MDLQFPIFPIFLSLFLFVFVSLKIFKRSHNNSSKLPPGPWKLPIIGNMHQLGGSLPHHGLRDLAKKYGPLMSVRLGQLQTVVVSSPEFAEEVLKTHDAIFAYRPRILMSEIMFYNSTDISYSPMGEYWRQLRKICTQELLSAARVKSLRPVREEEMRSLVDWIASNAGSPINLTKRIYTTNFGITSRAAFGKKSEDIEEFISIVMDAIGILGGFDLADLFPSFGFLDSLIFGTTAKLKRLHEKADRIYDNIIGEHKEKKAQAQNSGNMEIVPEDLIDVILKFHDNNHHGFSLTTDNIKAVIWVSWQI